MSNKTFSLNDKEQANFDKWKEKIKDLFGEYGTYSFTFVESGISYTVKAFSHTAKLEKDITDYDSW